MAMARNLGEYRGHISNMKNSQLVIVMLIFCALWLGCGIEAPPPEDARIYQTMKFKANELGAMHTKVDIDSSHPISGKTAIVVHWATNELNGPDDFQIEGFTQYFDGIAKAKVLDLWGLRPDTVAIKPSEIETVVRIGCTMGSRLADFHAENGRVVPAYATECLIEMIDFRDAVTFWQEVFRSSEIERSKKVLPIDSKVVASPPYEDIMEYVKNFKRD